MRLCSKITVLLLCACGSPSVSAQVVARFAGRHMLAEIAGNVSSTEQFDVRALHASLDLEMGPVEDVPAGNYTLEVRIVVQEPMSYYFSSSNPFDGCGRGLWGIRTARMGVNLGH